MTERTCKEHWKNKAKLGQDGESGGWRAREVAIVRNEPNCPMRGTEAVSQLRIADCAKQTQFPAGPEEYGARSEMCKTNPIGGDAGSRPGGYTPIFRRRR